MSIAWEVHCCENCSRMFDVEAPSLRRVCDECRIERKRAYGIGVRRSRGIGPARTRMTDAQRRERARISKAAWRERTGRH